MKQDLLEGFSVYVKSGGQLRSFYDFVQKVEMKYFTIVHFLSAELLLCCLLALTPCYSDKIVRGKQDLFKNTAGARIHGCSRSNAECFDRQCDVCQCKTDQTFLPTRLKIGQCVPNELLVYATCKYHMKCIAEVVVFGALSQGFSSSTEIRTNRHLSFLCSN